MGNSTSSFLSSPMGMHTITTIHNTNSQAGETVKKLKKLKFLTISSEAMACLRQREVLKVTIFNHSHTEGKPSVPKEMSSFTVSGA